jgi:hypothetical protein
MKRGFEPGAGRNITSAVDTVTEHWGGGDAARVPDWVMVFAEHCNAQTRTKVAERLGYSPAVVSQVLNGSYKGNLERVEGVIRGAFLASIVQCPVNGETPLDVCLKDQNRTPPFASSWRQQVFKACRNGCPNYRGGK